MHMMLVLADVVEGRSRGLTSGGIITQPSHGGSHFFPRIGMFRAALSSPAPLKQGSTEDIKVTLRRLTDLFDSTIK